MENGLPKESGLTNACRDFRSKFGFKGSKEPLPQDDPFYGYNATVEELKPHAPGTILRSRAIYLSDFPGFHADEMIGWQIAFVSSGQTQDAAMNTVATVIVPPNAGDRSKILVLAPKTDSACPDCRTSYTLRRGSGSISGAASEQIFMIDFLRRGYIIAQVDYEGQYDAFGAGPTAGHSLLDSIRATLAFKELKLAPTEKVSVVGWGYSGGAVAIGWAAQMLETYAPELSGSIKGWSMGGVPADLFQVAHHVNDNLAAGLIIGVFRGLSNVYPKLEDWMQANTNQEGKDMLAIAKNKCFWSFMPANAFSDVLNLKPGGSGKDAGYFTVQGDPLTQPLAKEIMEENHLGAELPKTGDKKLVPKVPMFVYESIPDEVVPIAVVDDLIAQWTKNGVCPSSCKRLACLPSSSLHTTGATIKYSRVEGWLHVGTIFAMQARNVQWISDCFEGKPVDVETDGPTQVASVPKIDDEHSQKVLGVDRSRALAAFYEARYKHSAWW